MFGNAQARHAYEKTGIVPPGIISDCFFNYRIKGYTYTGRMKYETCKHCGHTKEYWPALPLPRRWRIIDELAQELITLRTMYLEAKKLSRLLRKG